MDNYSYAKAHRLTLRTGGQPLLYPLYHICTAIMMRKRHIIREIYSRLSLSRTLKDSLKYIEIPVLRHIRFPELRENQTTNYPKFIGDLSPLLKICIYKNYCGKGEKLLLKSNFSSYP